MHRTVFDACYLVLGLGDVYLGAPVATPLDPRHRLVTTKYNPARTWTPENAVGIGGAYLCVYGMEGPGGYQFVGRTVQVWNRFRRGGLFGENPWALRFFDQIQWYPVDRRGAAGAGAETDAGRGDFDDRRGSSRSADHDGSWPRTPTSIAAFRAQRPRSATRRNAGAPSGSSTARPTPAAGASGDGGSRSRRARPRDGAVHATVWQVVVEPGDQVAGATCCRSRR